MNSRARSSSGGASAGCCSVGVSILSVSCTNDRFVSPDCFLFAQVRIMVACNLISRARTLFVEAGHNLAFTTLIMRFTRTIRATRTVRISKRSPSGRGSRCFQILPSVSEGSKCPCGDKGWLQALP